MCVKNLPYFYPYELSKQKLHGMMFGKAEAKRQQK
jgi:hypothetical protein